MEVMRTVRPGYPLKLEGQERLYLAEALATYKSMMEPEACRAPAKLNHCILRPATN